MPNRHLLVPPRDPVAEPICTLDRETALRRQEPPDKLLNEAIKEQATGDGIEYTFNSAPDLWARIETFISEEGDCCPFLAFEVDEHEGVVSLKAYQP